MPTRSYSNRDLNRFRREAPEFDPVVETYPPEFSSAQNLQPGDPGFDWSTYDEFRAGNDPLAEAQRSLTRANQLATETGSADIAAIPVDLNKIVQAHRQERPSLRALTEGIATPAPWLLGAAIPASLTGVGGAALGVAGTALAAPDILRRAIYPESDESRLGAIAEGATYTGGPAAVSAGSKALKSMLAGRRTRQAYTGAREAFETGATKAGRPGRPEGPGKLGLAREAPPYAGEPVTDLNQALDIARRIAAEEDISVRQVLRRSSGFSPSIVALLRQLDVSGIAGGAGRHGRLLAKRAAREKAIAEGLAKAGGGPTARNVPPESELIRDLLPEGGLESIPRSLRSLRSLRRGNPASDLSEL